MSRDRDTGQLAEKAPGWKRWIRILSIGLIAGALVSYLRDFDTSPQPLPLAPLTVSSDLASLRTLPLAPGSLRGQNVLVITLDTTRPDRLGCYGNAEISTPHLDGLAARGVVFSNAVSTGSTTLPTHASIFTGLYPTRHGARSNGHHRLDEEHATLAEVLSANGYETAAFVSSFVLEARFGLDQGFDVYDDQAEASSGYMGPSERRGDQTTDRAIEWLAAPRSEPFFLWVHYYDPHARHDPPEPFSNQYEQPYDGEIAFVDHQIGRLLKAVEAASDRGTLVVAIADHAEALGEHGEWTHGYLVQEATLRIPLIMHARSGLGRGVHVSTRVSQVDLLPTLLAGLGIDVPEGLDGIDAARPPTETRAVWAENMDGRARYGWARLAAVYQGAFKYVEGPSPELYDLEKDPLERHDVFAEHRADATRLAKQLEALQGPDADRLAGSTVTLRPADVARLEALGYAVGGLAERQTTDEGADPKQMLPTLLQLQTLLSDYERDKDLPPWRRAIAVARGRDPLTSESDLILALEALAEEHPDFTPTYRYLGKLYRDWGRVEEARRAVSLSRRPPSPERVGD